jgi:hypothetical protein
MRKIRLDVDTLVVESFSPADGAGTPAGTVHARQDAGIPTLDTGYHGCYACPATIACLADTPLCPDTNAGG